MIRVIRNFASLLFAEINITKLFYSLMKSERKKKNRFFRMRDYSRGFLVHAIKILARDLVRVIKT